MEKLERIMIKCWRETRWKKRATFIPSCARQTTSKITRNGIMFCHCRISDHQSLNTVMLPKKWFLSFILVYLLSTFVLSLASDLGSPQFGPQLHHLHHHHLLLRLHIHLHLKHLELHLHVTLPTPTTCTSLNHCTGSVEHSQHNRRCFHWLPSWITSAWNELIVKPKLVTVDRVTSYWESSKFKSSGRDF